MPGNYTTHPGNVPPAIATRGEGPAGGPGIGYSPSGIPLASPTILTERLRVAIGGLLSDLAEAPACTGCRLRPPIVSAIAEIHNALASAGG